MNAIVLMALRRPYTFVVLAILILIYGVLAAIRTPTDIFPNIKIPVVAVVWTYNGLTPQDTSGRVIYYYERQLTGTVGNIEHIESQSLYGRGIVKIFFQQGTDVAAAQAQVVAVSQTVLKQMPTGITPPEILSYNASSVPVLALQVSSEHMTGSELYDLASNFRATEHRAARRRSEDRCHRLSGRDQRLARERSDLQQPPDQAGGSRSRHRGRRGQRLEDGLDTYLSVSVAQVTQLAARTAEIQVQTRQSQAAVTLIRAIGGGWTEQKLPTEKQVIPFRDRYTESQRFGKALRAAASEGLVYPSRRDAAGECLGLFFPDLAGRVMQARHLDYHWDGERVDLYRDAGSGQVFRVQ